MSLWPDLQVADRDDIGKTLTRVEEILNVASPASAIAAVQSSFDNSLEEGYEYGYAFEWMLDTARTDGRKLKVWQLSHIFFFFTLLAERVLFSSAPPLFWSQALEVLFELTRHPSKALKIALYIDYV